MESFVYKGTKDVYYKPDISLDAETGRCLLSGDSYLEDPAQFYEPVLNWMKQYMKEVRGPIVFDFKLTYFNTSSSRSIIEILWLLKEYKDHGGEANVNWYLEEDDDLDEEIDDFVLRTEIEINKIYC
ncbi:MAG: DUF1987 domain-containing protein [Bacteroidetes bacterium]|nr:DUF1987 domain-containing protein [Bacteroidota bacterium]